MPSRDSLLWAFLLVIRGVNLNEKRRLLEDGHRLVPTSARLCGKADTYHGFPLAVCTDVVSDRRAGR